MKNPPTCLTKLLTLSLSVGIALSLGACGAGNNKADTVASPPDIPEPPLLQTVRDDPNDIFHRLVYQDIIEIDEATLAAPSPQTEKQRTFLEKNLALVNAVQEGIKQGALTPPPYNKLKPVYFEPHTPITYGEFYTWALAFENPGFVEHLSQDIDNTLLEKESAAKGNTPKGQSEDPHSSSEPANDPFNPNTTGLTLPLETDGFNLMPDTPLTREALCLIYVILSKQEDKALALTADEMAEANPVKNPVYALAEFADLESLSSNAKKYVALSYQDNVFKNALFLKPATLVRGAGFESKKALTRGEALIFLNQFYASHNTR